MCKTYVKEKLKHEPKMDNRDENQENATRKVMKIVFRRLQKYKKWRSGGALGTIFSTFARCSDEFPKNSSKAGAKMRKVAPKMGQDGNKMAILAPTWEVLVRSWPQLVRFGGDLGLNLSGFGGPRGGFWEHF